MDDCIEARAEEQKVSFADGYGESSFRTRSSGGESMKVLVLAR